MAASMLAMLILALAFTAIGVKMIQKVDQGTSKGYDKQLCKQSVIMNSKGRLPVLNNEKFVLDCPTRYVTFDKHKIITESRNYKDEEKMCELKFGESYNQCFLNKANEKIANMLFDCWDQFAAGRLQVLDTWNNEERQCVLCSRFDFSEEVYVAFKSDVGDLEIGFTRYRNDDDIEQDFTLQKYMLGEKPPHHTIYYYDYCMDPLDVFDKPIYDYNLKDAYAIVFRAVNKHQANEMYEGLWDKLKGETLVMGNEDDQGFVNTMSLMKYDEVIEQCDTLA